MQIRDVPDDVHAALVAAADDAGLSLTRYVLRELEGIAKRGEAVRHNAKVILQAQAEIGGRADRDTILAVLHEGRGD